MALELAWEAFENSGIVPSSVAGSDCGVFLGISSTDYAYRLSDDLAGIDASVATGSTPSIAANRISYVFDLRGPSLAIDTACSSSLVAFHQACQAIRTGECSLALAGGVSLHMHPYSFVIFSKASMLSRQGRCRVFDASGDGYVRSEGGGLFVLKAYEQAVADGDPILAVVAASGVNTDGYKSGLTVPRPEAQAALLTEVYARAGIAPESIDYIEAHGTGTAVGDPVETHAIGMAIGQRRGSASPIPIGSVKSNLGHLEPASGVAGLAKAILSLRHRTVPATIGVQRVNPKIQCDAWNIDLVTENRSLKPEGTLTIGVNSFGFGGANAHVVLQSHASEPLPAARPAASAALPLLLSGQDLKACRDAARRLAGWLRETPETALYDVAHTLLFKRERLRHRAALFAADTSEATTLLDRFAENGDEAADIPNLRAATHEGSVAFVYSGNGSQWLGMGRTLLQLATFREAVAEVDALFEPLSGFSLLDVLNSDEDRYASTAIAQPALFAVQVGMTRLLAERGVKPHAVTGHSVGEVAAAWASGALTLADAVAVIYERSRLQETTRGQGQMTAVALGEAELTALLEALSLNSGVVLAGSNSPTGTTAAGDAAQLEVLEAALAQRQVRFKRLPLDYAFHSPAMEPIRQPIHEALASMTPRPAEIDFYSTVTGHPLDGPRLDAGYWWQNIRQPVRFAEAIDALIEGGCRLFVEVGPHAVMRGYLNEILQSQEQDGHVVVTGLRDETPVEAIDRAAAQVVACGGELDWAQLFPVGGRFVPLPNYPWQRERYWREPSSESQGLLQRYPVHPLLGWPVAQHALCWENRLDPRLQPMLADHVVGDATVFPGTGFIEQALAAASLQTPEADWLELEGIEIRTPLTLDGENSRLVRLTIDELDNRFSIRAREHGRASAWTVHAVGRILPEPHGLRARDLPPLVPPVCKPDFVETEHTALTLRAGLTYGPAFRCIRHGWMEPDGSILAQLDWPERIREEVSEHLLHPALLDCTFQLIIQLLQDEVAAHHDGVYVPVSMGRVTCRRTGEAPAFGRATLVGRTAHSLTALFTLYDANGQVVARIEEGRFRHVRLKRSSGLGLSFLDHYLTPAPLADVAQQQPAIPFNEVAGAMGTLTERFVEAGLLDRFVLEVDPLLDGLCAHFVAEAVASAPDAEKDAWHGRLIEMAEQDGLLQPDAERMAAAELWRGLMAEYPDYSDLILAVGRIGLRLGDDFAGKASRSALFDWQPDLAELLTHTIDPSARRELNRAVQQIVTDGQRGLARSQRFSLVEISAGQPVVSNVLLPAFDFRRGDLHFASTSMDGCSAAEPLRDHYPRLAVEWLDEAHDPSSATRSATLVVMTLNFTRRDEAERALRFARARLAPGGVLLLIGYPLSRWMDLVMGATQEDWFEQRTLFSRSAWQQRLSEHGFTDISLHNLSHQSQATPYLMLARGPAATQEEAPRESAAPRHWLLHTQAEHPLVSALSALLTQSGDQVSLLMASEQTEVLAQQMGQVVATTGPVSGVVSLGAPPLTAADPTALLQTTTDHCTALAVLSQACSLAGLEAPCWVVTHGAHSLQEDSADAAVWGFGRTLANESSELRVHLIDLEPGQTDAAAATALHREVTQTGDAEREIILGADGARLAPRLTIDPEPFIGENSVEQDETPTRQLGFVFPGQLGHLEWFAKPRAMPGPSEVEVAVHATGLNFRDVMFALGLLPDEAIETGFAGPTLGLEFAGKVLRVGEGVEGYAVGDEVVGFGPSSFANKAITQTSALARIPAGLSFEAAASIPSAFFTVYYALHHLARLQPGERILIHGAAGAVGIAAIQIAQWIGAEVHATVGSAEKRDFVRLLGVEHIYHSRSLAYADEVMAATEGRGVDVVLNSLAGEAVLRNFQVLRPFGRFLELGKRDFYENSRIGLRPFKNNISYFGIDADQLMNERPELTRQLFAEVMQLFEEGGLSPLPLTLFEAGDVVDAFRHMQQARQIGKIVVTYRNGIPPGKQPRTAPNPSLTLKPEATWLVTGGLSGFGLKTAEWLAQKGARHLVLASRSGKPGREAEETIRALKVTGVQVHVRACDVAQERDLSALLKSIDQEMPPLRGIVHAAVVIDDGLVRNLDRAQIERVLRPKLLGAELLHRMTRELPIEAFILFSSATTLFGNPGQSSYVAANYWMEALARRRLAQGLPATVALWGAIDDAGFLARNEQIKEALQSRMGGAAIPSSTALEALEQMLVSRRSGLGVLELDWGSLARFLPTAATPRFADLACALDNGELNDEGGEDIARLLAELDPEALHARFSTMLREEVGSILRLSAERIDPDRSLFDMGLDSLMGVELSVALEGRFGTRLPVMALQESATIHKLAHRLIAQLQGDSNTEDQSLDQVAQSAQRHGAMELDAEARASIAASLNQDPQRRLINDE